jgi:hypothetical protein
LYIPLSIRTKIKGLTPFRNYRQITFIEMGVEPDDRFEITARDEADEKNWKFEKVSGDLTLLQQLLSGDWNPDDFLVVQPGQRILADHTERIVIAR